MDIKMIMMSIMYQVSCEPMCISKDLENSNLLSFILGY